MKKKVNKLLKIEVKTERMFTMDVKKDDRTCFAHGNENIFEIDLNGIRGLAM